MNFAEKLKTLRKEYGYSQEALAELLGVSRQAVCKWENGQGYPEIETLVSISQILGVSVDYLLKEEESRNESKGYYVSSEMLDGYLNYKHGFARSITIGVCFILISSVFLVKGSVVSDILEYLCLLAGIAIIILQLAKPNRYKIMYHQELLFGGTTVSAFQAKYYRNKRWYAFALIAGFALLFGSEVVGRFCIAGNMNEIAVMNIETSMDILAIGLFLLCGLMYRSDKFIMDKMEESAHSSNAWLYVAVPVTVIAVMIGFLFNAWSPIFPLVLFSCILLLKLCKKKGEKNKERK